MAVPGKQVRIAFGALPADGVPAVGAWQDITPYIREIHTRFGRSRDLDRIEAATASLIVDNTDARFTPLNTTSPYYPNVVPFALVDIRWLSENTNAPFQIGVAQLGQTNATLYDLPPAFGAVFRGFVERWPLTWYKPNGGMVEITCVDLFRFFQIPTISRSYPQQTVGQRITQILRDIQNPFPVDIDSTGATLAAGSITSNALEYMRSIAYLDGGLFYIRGDGTIIFRSRVTLHALPSYRTAQAVLGDGPGEINYIDIHPSMDEQLIVNEIDGETSDGTPISAQRDTVSQSKYLRRPYDFGATSLLNSTELSQRAILELAVKSRERLAMENLEFEMLDPATDTPTLIGLDLYDRVTVTRRPDQGSVISADYLVQGIDDDITVETWRRKIHVTSVPTACFTLGISRLGVDTTLHFGDVPKSFVLGTASLGHTTILRN